MSWLWRIFRRGVDKESSSHLLPMPMRIEKGLATREVSFFLRALGEVLLYFLEKNKAGGKKLPEFYAEGQGRRMIHSGLDPEELKGTEYGFCGPGERWAIINGRPTRIRLPL